MYFRGLSKRIKKSQTWMMEGKADGGALFVVTTCMSIICLGLAFVGGNIPDKFAKANPRTASPGQIVAAPAQNSLQLLMFKADLPKLIPTIDPKAPPLSTDKTPTAAPAGTGVSGCTPAGPNDPEPPADYTRTTYGGQTVNQRTKVMLQTAERYASGFGVTTPFTLTQGSYSTGVAASAGTHDGGGAADISVGGMSATQINDAIKALRMAGFAAWYRTPAEGFGVHIHVQAIGDSEASSVAASQITDFFAGKNGLAGKGPDTAPASVGRPIPAWAGKYGSCT